MPGSTYAATDGAVYEVFLGRWSRRLAMPFLDFLAPRGDGALLDVGCGTGSVARAMRERWPARKVSGIDIAQPYIDFARA
jgi:trans-aconitate methyltransferase